MARPKSKESEARAFRLQKDLCDQLDMYADKSKLSKTTIVELALQRFFDVAPAPDQLVNSILQKEVD